MVAYPGVHAMEMMPMDISPNVRIRPARRPWRSVYAPRTMAPSGRIRKPAPNVISDNITHERIAAGEEGIADRGCVVTKDHEVIHLQKISAGDAHHRPDLRFPISGRDHGLI